jgi:hypothetical protein
LGEGLVGGEEEEVEGEGDAGGLEGVLGAGAVDGEEEVMEGGGVEFGGVLEAVLGEEAEGGLEGLKGAGEAIAGSAAELDEVVGGRDGNQEATTGAEDTADFGGGHAGGDGENQGEGSGGVGEEAIGIGDNPTAVGVTAGGGVEGAGGDVDAIGGKAITRGKGTEEETFAAADIKDSIGRLGAGDLGKGIEHGSGDAAGVEAAAGGDGWGGIAGETGAAILGLKEVEVAAAGEIKAVTGGAGIATGLREKGETAAANGAKEHVGEARLDGQGEKVDGFLATGGGDEAWSAGGEGESSDPFGLGREAAVEAAGGGAVDCHQAPVADRTFEHFAPAKQVVEHVRLRG